MSNLDGRTALVTGATSGIGRAIAIALAGEGARVLLNGRNSGNLSALADLIRETDGNADAVPGDLTDSIALAGVASRAAEEGPDVLVHSAGVVSLGEVAETSAGDLDRQWALNARAPYLLTQALLPGIVERKGQIVFVNSGAGNRAGGGWSAYAMSKHALRALADSLRAEVAEKGVRVISVYPGRTATPMQEDVHRMENREYRPESFVQPEDIALQVVAALTLSPNAVVTDVSVRSR